ncbi:hypothetical protein VIC_004407 [Vibrio coralliilyticus ATCC BAA-450]|nr:hypothetical protein VIC_004407 [Vibrio coralliilyticus ATCC BAA-450]
MYRNENKYAESGEIQKLKMASGTKLTPDRKPFYRAMIL